MVSQVAKVRETGSRLLTPAADVHPRLHHYKEPYDKERSSYEHEETYVLRTMRRDSCNADDYRLPDRIIDGSRYLRVQPSGLSGSP